MGDNIVEKFKMETPDLTAANVQKIAELFPGVVAEPAPYHAWR